MQAVLRTKSATDKLFVENFTRENFTRRKKFRIEKHATGFTKKKSACNRFHEQKSAKIKFHEQNWFYEEKHQCTNFTS